MSDVTLLRKLTFRSTLKFGKFFDLTVQDILNSKGYYGKEYLIWVYYSASKITFMPDVLFELGIEPDKEIEKPGCVEKELTRSYKGDALQVIKEREKEVLGNDGYLEKCRKGKASRDREEKDLKIIKQRNDNRKFSAYNLKSKNQNN